MWDPQISQLAPSIYMRRIAQSRKMSKNSFRLLQYVCSEPYRKTYYIHPKSQRYPKVANNTILNLPWNTRNPDGWKEFHSSSTARKIGGWDMFVSCSFMPVNLLHLHIIEGLPLSVSGELSNFEFNDTFFHRMRAWM